MLHTLLKAQNGLPNPLYFTSKSTLIRKSVGVVRTSQKPQYVLFSTLSYLIAVLVWLFVWEKNSGATALFDAI